MSALTKLYAGRAGTASAEGLQVKPRAAPAATRDTSLQTAPTRTFREERSVEMPSQIVGEAKSQQSSSEYNYKSALEVLTNVSAGFNDLYERLQQADLLNGELAAECETRNQTIQNLSSEIEELRSRLGDLESENADLAERLVGETSRGAVLEQRASETEHLLEDARLHNNELEDICKKLHDGIYSVFGGESITQRVMKTFSR